MTAASERAGRAGCALLDGLGPGRGARRARVEPLRLGRPLRRGAQGRLQRPRHLARRPRARARDAQPAGDEAGLRRQRAAPSRGRVPARLVPRPGRRAPPRLGRTRALLFEAAGVLGAHHVKVANIFGREASLAQLTERFGELCADAAGHTDAKIVYELMPPDVNVHTIDAVLEVVGRCRRAERRRRDRHVAHVEARDRAGRAAPHPRRVPVVGRALRRPGREHGRPGGRGDQPSRAARARASSTSAATSTPAATTATPARGASRCSPRSCATIRSTSSSGAPTTRRSPSSSAERSSA